jgi:hypothetical protein
MYTQNKILIKYNSILSKLVEISKGVHQGCPVSCLLCLIYLDEIITKWQKEDTKRIPLLRNQQLLTLLFAYDQVVISNTEDSLQKVAYKLNQIITGYCVIASVEKTQLMVFSGQVQVRSKIAVDNSFIDQVNSLNSLGNLISYEKEVDFDTNVITI